MLANEFQYVVRIGQNVITTNQPFYRSAFLQGGAVVEINSKNEIGYGSQWNKLIFHSNLTSSFILSYRL